MITPDPVQIVNSFRQAITDIKSAVDWLQAQPQVIPDQIGIVGISLGAIITNLAMGVEPRLKAGVSLVGGGDLPYILWHSLLTIGIKSRMVDAGISFERLKESLRRVDPLTYADRNLPRHLLMVNGSHDPILPRRAAEEFWQAAGQPLILWLPTGHYGVFFTRGRLFQLATDYLLSQFSGEPFPLEEHHFHAATLKLVGIYDRHEGSRLGILYELASLLNTDRFSADFGLTTRGFFAGLSWHVLEGLDAGIAAPLEDAPARPFLAARLTF